MHERLAYASKEKVIQAYRKAGIGYTAYVTKLKEKIVRSEKIAPRAWKGYLINEKAATLDTLYEVKHLEFLRLEFKRDYKAKTIRLALGSRPDITYSVKKLLEANCYLIYVYLVALKHLLRYLRVQLIERTFNYASIPIPYLRIIRLPAP
ncbi:hypothetical protein L249_6773 [Ophiocordyceps polyrhachis-furcata BCC 54312]|uniref:Uncharacterized protein n=1 Tax=Ophiocordyceps polyrhachis-furcata BCC 54312 TaxID=1330021 RepID=A0A367LLT7_9HYPO|nr:hypothetical protein L249_6773 [Ophiocordyceps polyrhachis-furcata BCC 54312]